MRTWGVDPASDPWCVRCSLPSMVTVVFDLTFRREAAPSSLRTFDCCTGCGQVVVR